MSVNALVPTLFTVCFYLWEHGCDDKPLSSYSLKEISKSIINSPVLITLWSSTSSSWLFFGVISPSPTSYGNWTCKLKSVNHHILTMEYKHPLFILIMGSQVYGLFTHSKSAWPGMTPSLSKKCAWPGVLPLWSYVGQSGALPLHPYINWSDTPPLYSHCSCVFQTSDENDSFIELDRKPQHLIIKANRRMSVAASVSSKGSHPKVEEQIPAWPLKVIDKITTWPLKVIEQIPAWPLKVIEQSALVYYAACGWD